MHHDFREDQERQGHQEAHVRLDVPQERHRHSAPGPALDHRDHEQRQPGEQRDEREAAPEQVERRLHHPGAPEELVQRAAEHEREVLGLGARILHRWPHGRESSALSV